MSEQVLDRLGDAYMEELAHAVARTRDVVLAWLVIEQLERWEYPLLDVAVADFRYRLGDPDDAVTYDDLVRLWYRTNGRFAEVTQALARAAIREERLDFAAGPWVERVRWPELRDEELTSLLAALAQDVRERAAARSWDDWDLAPLLPFYLRVIAPLAYTDATERWRWFSWGILSSIGLEGPLELRRAVGEAALAWDLTSEAREEIAMLGAGTT